MNEALVEDFKHVSLLSASEDKMKLTTGSLEVKDTFIVSGFII